VIRGLHNWGNHGTELDNIYAYMRTGGGAGLVDYRCTDGTYTSKAE
jgi:hypothetical protein